MTVLNFPSSPTVGATYTENNVIYTWNGTFWAANNAQDLDARFVNVTGDTMTGNLTVPSINGGQLAGFRNILVNGSLTINQRNVDISAAATGSYGQDRWKKTAGGMTQIIEAGNFDPGATYTLSGTGVTTQQLTAPGAGDWTLPDIPVTARKVQLEPGTVATPFEHRPYGTELMLCQRYCFVFDFNSQTVPQKYLALEGSASSVGGPVTSWNTFMWTGYTGLRPSASTISIPTAGNSLNAFYQNGANANNQAANVFTAFTDFSGITMLIWQSPASVNVNNARIGNFPVADGGLATGRKLVLDSEL